MGHRYGSCTAGSCPIGARDGANRVRILVTNDDGIEAPGIAALAAAATRTGNEVIVAAPLKDWSGASAAVGAFYSRDDVEYGTFDIEGLEGVPCYGVDAPPALVVILACVGGFGRRPDVVLSGINHGVNLGRAALHSGTIGAALTAAQFGVRGLATSMRYGPDPVPWSTAADLAVSLLPVIADAPPATVLNLNVPDVSAENLMGVRAARLGRGGTIRSVSFSVDGTTEVTSPTTGLPPGPRGAMQLDLAIPGSAGKDATLEDDPSGVDTLLVGHDFATLTALVGVREDAEAADVVAEAIKRLEKFEQ
jgi:5'-nucleotidase